MAIPLFPGSALVEHQNAHLEAILKGELQPVKVPERLPPKTARFLATARRTNFQPYAVNLGAGEPDVFILFLPEENQRRSNGTLDLAVGLFGETYERGMTLFDFYIASKGEGNDIHPWQWEALRYLNPQFKEKRVRPIRAADHEQRTREALALKESRLQEYLAIQLGRLGYFAERINDTDGGKTALALMSLHHGCNPAFFDGLDERSVTYAAVVPRYQVQKPKKKTGEPEQLVFTTVLYGKGWLFASGPSGHLDKIQDILKGNGVTEEPLSTGYHGHNETGYARINRGTQIYALPDAGVVTVELLHMRGENGDATRRRTLLTVSVPAAHRTLAEKLGQYVHGI